MRVQGRARKAEPCAGILWRPVPFAVGSCVAGIDPSRVWISCHGRAWVRSKATSADSGAQAGGADAGGGGGPGIGGGGKGDESLKEPPISEPSSAGTFIPWNNATSRLKAIQLLPQINNDRSRANVFWPAQTNSRSS